MPRPSIYPGRRYRRFLNTKLNLFMNKYISVKRLLRKGGVERFGGWEMGGGVIVRNVFIFQKRNAHRWGGSSGVGLVDVDAVILVKF